MVDDWESRTVWAPVPLMLVVTPSSEGEVVTYTAQKQMVNGFPTFSDNMRLKDKGLQNQPSWMERDMMIDQYGLVGWTKMLAMRRVRGRDAAGRHDGIYLAICSLGKAAGSGHQKVQMVMGQFAGKIHAGHVRDIRHIIMSGAGIKAIILVLKWDYPAMNKFSLAQFTICH